MVQRLPDCIGRRHPETLVRSPAGHPVRSVTGCGRSHVPSYPTGNPVHHPGDNGGRDSAGCLRDHEARCPAHGEARGRVAESGQFRSQKSDTRTHNGGSERAAVYGLRSAVGLSRPRLRCRPGPYCGLSPVCFGRTPSSRCSEPAGRHTCRVCTRPQLLSMTRQ